MDVLFYITISIFALIGFMATIRAGIIRLFTTGETEKITEVIHLSGDNAEFVLLGVLNRFRWRIDRYNYKIIALDMGLDDLNLERCNKICEDYSIPICKREDVIDYIGDNCG